MKFLALALVAILSISVCSIAVFAEETKASIGFGKALDSGGGRDPFLPPGGGSSSGGGGSGGSSRGGSGTSSGPYITPIGSVVSPTSSAPNETLFIPDIDVPLASMELPKTGGNYLIPLMLLISGVWLVLVAWRETACTHAAAT